VEIPITNTITSHEYGTRLSFILFVRNEYAHAQITNPVFLGTAIPALLAAHGSFILYPFAFSLLGSPSASRLISHGFFTVA
jgi:hypothetical protein